MASNRRGRRDSRGSRSGGTGRSGGSIRIDEDPVIPDLSGSIIDPDQQSGDVQGARPREGNVGLDLPPGLGGEIDLSNIGRPEQNAPPQDIRPGQSTDRRSTRFRLVTPPKTSVQTIDISAFKKPDGSYDLNRISVVMQHRQKLQEAEREKEERAGLRKVPRTSRLNPPRASYRGNARLKGIPLPALSNLTEGSSSKESEQKKQSEKQDKPQEKEDLHGKNTKASQAKEEVSLYFRAPDDSHTDMTEKTSPTKSEKYRRSAEVEGKSLTSREKFDQWLAHRRSDPQVAEEDEKRGQIGVELMYAREQHIAELRKSIATARDMINTGVRDDKEVNRLGSLIVRCETHLKEAAELEEKRQEREAIEKTLDVETNRAFKARSKSQLIKLYREIGDGEEKERLRIKPWMRKDSDWITKLQETAHMTPEERAALGGSLTKRLPGFTARPPGTLPQSNAEEALLQRWRVEDSIYEDRILEIEEYSNKEDKDHALALLMKERQPLLMERHKELLEVWAKQAEEVKADLETAWSKSEDDKKKKQKKRFLLWSSSSEEQKKSDPNQGKDPSQALPLIQKEKEEKEKESESVISWGKPEEEKSNTESDIIPRYRANRSISPLQKRRKTKQFTTDPEVGNFLQEMAEKRVKPETRVLRVVNEPVDLDEIKKKIDEAAKPIVIDKQTAAKNAAALERKQARIREAKVRIMVAAETEEKKKKIAREKEKAEEERKKAELEGGGDKTAGEAKLTFKEIMERNVREREERKEKERKRAEGELERRKKDEEAIDKDKAELHRREEERNKRRVEEMEQREKERKEIEDMKDKRVERQKLEKEKRESSETPESEREKKEREKREEKELEEEEEKKKEIERRQKGRDDEWKKREEDEDRERRDEKERRIQKKREEGEGEEREKEEREKAKEEEEEKKEREERRQLGLRTQRKLQAEREEWERHEREREEREEIEQREAWERIQRENQERIERENKEKDDRERKGRNEKARRDLKERYEKEMKEMEGKKRDDEARKERKERYEREVKERAERERKEKEEMKIKEREEKEKKEKKERERRERREKEEKERNVREEKEREVREEKQKVEQQRKARELQDQERQARERQRLEQELERQNRERQNRERDEKQQREELQRQHKALLEKQKRKEREEREIRKRKEKEREEKEETELRRQLEDESESEPEYDDFKFFQQLFIKLALFGFSWLKRTDNNSTETKSSGNNLNNGSLQEVSENDEDSSVATPPPGPVGPDSPPDSPAWLHDHGPDLPPLSHIHLQIEVFTSPDQALLNPEIPHYYVSYRGVPLSWNISQLKRFLGRPKNPLVSGKYAEKFPGCVGWTRKDGMVIEKGDEDEKKLRLRLGGRWLKHGGRTLREEGFRDWENLLVVMVGKDDDLKGKKWRECLEEADGVAGFREGWPGRGDIRVPRDRVAWLREEMDKAF